MALLTGHRIRLVKAEEESILHSATVHGNLRTPWTPDGNVIINGSFKSYIDVELWSPEIIV